MSVQTFKEVQISEKMESVTLGDLEREVDEAIDDKMSYSQNILKIMLEIETTKEAMDCIERSMATRANIIEKQIIRVKEMQKAYIEEQNKIESEIKSECDAQYELHKQLTDVKSRFNLLRLKLEQQIQEEKEEKEREEEERKEKEEREKKEKEEREERERKEREEREERERKEREEREEREEQERREEQELKEEIEKIKLDKKQLEEKVKVMEEEIDETEKQLTKIKSRNEMINKLFEGLKKEKYQFAEAVIYLMNLTVFNDFKDLVNDILPNLKDDFDKNDLKNCIIEKARAHKMKVLVDSVKQASNNPDGIDFTFTPRDPQKNYPNLWDTFIMDSFVME